MPTDPRQPPAHPTPPQDFNIPPPRQAGPAAPPPAASPPPVSAPASLAAPSQPPPGAVALQPAPPMREASLTANGAMIGLLILLLLAVVFFMVRGALRNHLIAHKASPSAAGNAGWALFALLLSMAVTAVFGFLGGFWDVLAFSVPLGLMVLVTLILFVVLYRSAAAARR